MRIQKTFFVLIMISLVFSLAFSATALATDDYGRIDSVLDPPAVTTTPAQLENIPAMINAEKDAKNLFKEAAKLVRERITALAKLNSKIRYAQISNQQKVALKAEIDKAVASLNNLAAEIKSIKDLNTLKTKVKRIFTDFRVFAVLLPKIHAVLALKVEQRHLDNLNDAVKKLQTRADKAKAKGMDITARQKALADAKAMLPKIQDKITSLQNKANNLKPADYPTASIGIIESIRKGIDEIQKDFKTVKQALKTQSAK